MSERNGLQLMTVSNPQVQVTLATVNELCDDLS
jgi:hypothetical protein